MYTYTLLCTRRRNARPVNINHIVIRSRTIIRSAAALLHGRRLWSAAWKIIFNVFQPTFRGWKTEKNIQHPSLPTVTHRRRVLVCLNHAVTEANHTILWCVSTNLTLYTSVYIMRTVYAIFFIRMILFFILSTAAPHYSCNNICYYYHHDE